MSAWIIMNLNSINYDLLQNISFEYGVPMAQLGLKNMFINKMFINAHLEILSVLFRVKNGWNKKMFYRHCFKTLL